MGLETLVHGKRTNAVIGWAAAFVVLAAAAVGVVTDDPVWGGFSILLVAAIAAPAVATRDWTTMAPWPLFSVGALAVTSRAVGLYPEAAGHVAIATLALVVVVELDVFTPIQLSRRFAVGFAVLTTLAIEAVWIIVQFLSDEWLGSEFLTTQTELQETIVTVTVVGFAIGVVFYWYLTRFAPAGLVAGSSNREQTP